MAACGTKAKLRRPSGSQRASILQMSIRDLNLRSFAVAASLAVLIVAAVSAYDLLVLGRPPQMEGPPDLTAYGLARSVLILAISAFLVCSVWQVGKERRASPNEPGSKYMAWTGPVSALLALVFAGIFLWSPAVYHRLSLETGLVEWGSAVALFLACIVFFYTAAVWRANTVRRPGSPTVSMILSGTMFFLAMEETSWLQHLLHYETPAFLAGNTQNEANLHNIHTNFFENLYYLGAFGFLIGLPFLNKACRLVPDTHWTAPFIPGQHVLLTSVPMAGFNWDMWNIVPVQMAFFLTILILAYYLVDAWRHKQSGRASVVLAVAATVLPQLILLSFGTNMFRDWEATEYKEFFIALGLLAYAAHVAAAIGRGRTMDTEA